jgi:hypothetical protein
MCILIGAPILQPLIGWLLNADLNKNIADSAAYQHALGVLPLSLLIGLVLAFCVKETYCGRKATH